MSRLPGSAFGSAPQPAPGRSSGARTDQARAGSGQQHAPAYQASVRMLARPSSCPPGPERPDRGPPLHPASSIRNCTREEGSQCLQYAMIPKKSVSSAVQGRHGGRAADARPLAAGRGAPRHEPAGRPRPHPATPLRCHCRPFSWTAPAVELLVGLVSEEQRVAATRWTPARSSLAVRRRPSPRGSCRTSSKCPAVRPSPGRRAAAGRPHRRPAGPDEREEALASEGPAAALTGRHEPITIDE